MLPSILNINNFHFVRGGSDKYFIELTRLLLEKGHQVRTFASRHAQDIENGWKVSDLPVGVDTNGLGSFRNLVHFLYSAEARKKIEEGLLRFKPDIAHLHIYYGQLTASILSPLRRQSIPIVQTLHEYKLVCATHGLYSRGQFCDRCKGHAYWNALFEKCNRGSLPRTALSVVEAYVSATLGDKTLIDRFIAVSEYQRMQLVRLGISPEKLRVVHHFADPVEDPPKEFGEYFLYVGRMVKEKGLVLLLNAYVKLKKPRPKLVLVGDGGDADLIRCEVQILGLKDDVVFMGHQKGKALSDLYRGCICVINPSLLNETFGLTVLESLANGRPVIVSRIGALPEVVRKDETGLLVQPGNANELTAAMEFMRKNMAEALQMGLAGWHSVKLNYSKETHYEKIREIYQELH